MRVRPQYDVEVLKRRSSITNGSKVLAGIDQRSAPARRYRDLAYALTQDLGGADNLTEAQRQLIRSAAGLIVLRERLDAMALRDEKIDSADYVRITNGLRRVLQTLGLHREPRDVTPDLRDYIASKRNGRVMRDRDDDYTDAEIVEDD